MSIGALHQSLVQPRRVRRLASLCAQYLPPGSRVLDIGAGSGEVGAEVAALRPDIEITGVDVLVRKNPAIAVTAFDGQKLPFSDRSFTACLLIDVLHHTRHAEQLLSEALRVSSHGVVIKDHLCESTLDQLTLVMMDFVGNSRFGVHCPGYYRSMKEWRELFDLVKCRVAKWTEDVNLYSFPANLLFDRRLHFVAAVSAE